MFLLIKWTPNTPSGMQAICRSEKCNDHKCNYVIHIHHMSSFKLLDITINKMNSSQQAFCRNKKKQKQIEEGV